MWHLTAYVRILLSVWPCRRVIKTIYITLFSYCARMQFGNINAWGFVRSKGCHYQVQNAITTTTCLYEYIGFIFDPHIGSILMMHINISWWKVIPGPRSSCPFSAMASARLRPWISRLCSMMFFSRFLMLRAKRAFWMHQFLHTLFGHIAWTVHLNLYFLWNYAKKIPVMPC